ncbi:MAG: hypothetical protein KA715_03050 [Xanthomonadaceae bacterium]|nr:hypothetical protein [Xanthomonadaceae bacterium]
MNFGRLSLVIVNSLAVLTAGCSSTEIIEPLPKLPEVPTYAHVAHPQGYDLTDIRLLFYSKLSPKPDALNGCESEMLKLRTLTTSIDEITGGARELVIKDPVKYHWCFYAKMLEVYDSLKSNETFWLEKQKRLMEIYLTLVPIARAFKVEYGDVRYLRAASRQYKQMSEWVFYRKLDTTPDGTMELMEDVSNPFSLWKKPEMAQDSVLEKYGISKSEPSPMGLPMPEERAPAALKLMNPTTENAPSAQLAAPSAPVATAPITAPILNESSLPKAPVEEPVSDVVPSP